MKNIYIVTYLSDDGHAEADWVQADDWQEAEKKLQEQWDEMEWEYPEIHHQYLIRFVDKIK